MSRRECDEESFQYPLSFFEAFYQLIMNGRAIESDIGEQMQRLNDDGEIVMMRDGKMFHLGSEEANPVNPRSRWRIVDKEEE